MREVDEKQEISLLSTRHLELVVLTIFHPQLGQFWSFPRQSKCCK